MVAGEWWRREEMAEWEEAVVGRLESFEQDSWVCEEHECAEFWQGAAVTYAAVRRGRTVTGLTARVKT